MESLYGLKACLAVAGFPGCFGSLVADAHDASVAWSGGPESGGGFRSR